jgi:hypothetical protein
MDQIAEEIQRRGGGAGSGPDTGKLACSPSGQGRFKFLDSVASIQSNPFTDSHAISMLTDVPVDNLDRVGTSTYVDENTGGQLWTSFLQH